MTNIAIGRPRCRPQQMTAATLTLSYTKVQQRIVRFILLSLLLVIFHYITGQLSLFPMGSFHGENEQTTSFGTNRVRVFGLYGVEATKEADLYVLLGVSRTATTKEIKSAYRRKALDTHPDKNLHVDPAVAAEQFHQVVHAFEILSDEHKRRMYDRTGRDPGATNSDHGAGGGFNGGFGRGSAGGSQHQYHFRWSFQQRTVRLKDKFEVQQAMSRVLHVTSLTHLETIMFDIPANATDGISRLERNVLIAFCNPTTETHLDDEMVYPYPFAGMSSQSIWWEDLLQTVKVRFHRKNDLAEHLGIPPGDKMSAPYFAFGRRGQALDDPWEQMTTTNRQSFETWVWHRIEIDVVFVNHHLYPVEIYWIHGSIANIKTTIAPSEEWHHSTYLSHEWWARDARTETLYNRPLRTKLSHETSLGSWKIIDDTSPQRIIIQTPDCYDLSGHCSFWKHSDNSCLTNPEFMCVNCPLTCRDVCGLCEEEKRKLGHDNPSHAHEEL